MLAQKYFSNTNSVIILLLLICLVSKTKCSVYEEYIKKVNDSYLKNIQDASPECSEALDNLSLLSKIQLIDSSGKIPSGLLKMNMWDPGNFDECYQLKEEEVYGKYCVGTVAPSIPIKTNNKIVNFLTHPLNTTKETTVQLQIGYCLVSTCTHKDFQQVIPWGDFSSEMCYSVPDKYAFDFPDYMTLVIYGIIFIIVIISTIVDIYHQFNNQKPSRDIYIAFSLWTNCKKIMKLSNNQDQLSCINGIKSLSMMWVVYGHVANNIVSMLLDNMADVYTFLNEVRTSYLLAAPLAVDTFFTIGGLLTMFTFLKAKDKGIKLNVPLFYFHRYIRLTPAVLAIVLFFLSMFKHVGNGPLNAYGPLLTKNCRNYWWSSLLYIQNYVNVNEMCAGHTWYLSLDMQMFFLTPVALIPLAKWPKIGLAVLGFFALGGILSPFLVTYNLDLSASIMNQDTTQSDNYQIYYYTQTYARFGPYVIGMIFGYLIYNLRTNKKWIEKLETMRPQKRLCIALALWLFIIGGTLACTYGNTDVLRGRTTDIVSRSFHNGLNRNAWAIFVSMIVLVCSLNLGGPVNSFLSLPVFQILARLSYSIYLIHIIVIKVRLLNTKTLVNFSTVHVVNDFWADFMNTVVIAFFFSAIFESPFIIIEKVLLKVFGYKSKS